MTSIWNRRPCRARPRDRAARSGLRRDDRQRCPRTVDPVAVDRRRSGRRAGSPPLRRPKPPLTAPITGGVSRHAVSGEEADAGSGSRTRKLVIGPGQRRSGSAARPAWPGRSAPAPRPAAPAIRRGCAGRVHVAGELDIAAERQPADLPARAALVGPAGDLAAEADREGLRLHAEPAADEIMAELVDEDQRPDDEQEAQDRPEECRDCSTHASFSRWRRRPRRGPPGRSPAPRRASRAPAGHSIASSLAERWKRYRGSRCAFQKRRDRDFVGGVEDGRLGAALAQAPPGRGRARESAPGSGASKSSVPILTRSSRSQGVSIRSGQASV